METRSWKDAARSAVRFSGSWIARNRLAAGLIALLLIAALAGWGTAIERGRAADGYLKKAAEDTLRLRKFQAEAETAQRHVEILQGKVRESDRRLAESRRRLEEARRIAQAGFKPPATGAELLGRYQALGYRGRLK